MTIGRRQYLPKQRPGRQQEQEASKQCGPKEYLGRAEIIELACNQTRQNREIRLAAEGKKQILPEEVRPPAQ